MRVLIANTSCKRVKVFRCYGRTLHMQRRHAFKSVYLACLTKRILNAHVWWWLVQRLHGRVSIKAKDAKILPRQYVTCNRIEAYAVLYESAHGAKRLKRCELMQVRLQLKHICSESYRKLALCVRLKKICQRWRRSAFNVISGYGHGIVA